jgi:hypothetical protein
MVQLIIKLLRPYKRTATEVIKSLLKGNLHYGVKSQGASISKTH